MAVPGVVANCEVGAPDIGIKSLLGGEGRKLKPDNIHGQARLFGGDLKRSTHIRVAAVRPDE